MKKTIDRTLCMLVGAAVGVFIFGRAIRIVLDRAGFSYNELAARVKLRAEGGRLLGLMAHFPGDDEGGEAPSDMSMIDLNMN